MSTIGHCCDESRCKYRLFGLIFVGMLKTMAFFASPRLFPFPPLSNCNKESKGLRENKQREQGQEDREKEKEKERKRKREQEWLWAVEEKRWMKKDGHADKEGEMQSKVNK